MYRFCFSYGWFLKQRHCCLRGKHTDIFCPATAGQSHSASRFALHHIGGLPSSHTKRGKMIDAAWTTWFRLRLTRWLQGMNDPREDSFHGNSCWGYLNMEMVSSKLGCKNNRSNPMQWLPELSSQWGWHVWYNCACTEILYDYPVLAVYIWQIYKHCRDVLSGWINWSSWNSFINPLLNLFNICLCITVLFLEL